MIKKTLTISLLTLLASTHVMADEWKYAFEESLTEIQGVYATKFKEYIEENSEHSIRLYPYGTLGESVDVMEQAQAGIIQFIDQSPGFTGSIIPEAQVFYIPYILPSDQQHLVRFFRESKAINENFKPLYNQQGLELLTMFPEGEMAMATKEAVNTCSDLNGVKFRVMPNPLLVETYKEFGATPTPLPWGEVYGGLQTNMIQGQEQPTFYLYSTKSYEVTDHITYTGHNNFTTAVIANKEFFDSLSDEDKTLVKNAIDSAFDFIIEYQKDLTESEIEKIKAAKPSMNINILTEDQRQCFKQASSNVEKKFIQMTGETGKEILEQLKLDLENTK